MASVNTVLANLIDPEVLAPMVNGKVEKYIRVSPFAKIDNTLVGRPGSTITVPFYGHIGNAVVVAEGATIESEALSTSSKEYSIHKIGKGVTLTDEAVLSGYGDPVGQATTQLAQSVAQKIDEDCMGELLKGTQHFIGATALNYNAVVDGVDIFKEEFNSPKIIFIHPDQVKALRKDANFISADKYGVGTNVIMYGEIGMICNARVVTSKRVQKNAEFYYEVTSATTGALVIVADTATPSTGEVKLADVKAKAIGGYTPEVGDYVKNVSANTYFMNPIVRLVGEDEVETGLPAITIYLKRDLNLETDRISNQRKTELTIDKHYVSALTNDAVVCLLYVNA
jgi:N4-gp56 family major capsid protein